ncbi:MAG TPA: HlyD family type I secretion periplasmic adaptor subunit [Steroidobacteraceae bacterium]|nr:HlyD family type I secretion periplasmic adaptor subunit [Steroidobacteraceae bacterium]
MRKSESESPAAAAADPKLRLVKPARLPRDLTPAEREFLPPVLEILETPPSPVKRAVLWTVIAFVVTAIAWAVVGKISVVAAAPGRFIPDGRVKEIQPLESSIVKAIHVKEGQHVKRGDLLLELDPTLDAADVAADADKYGFNQLEQARLSAELTDRMPQYSRILQPRARVAMEEQMRRARERDYQSKLTQAQAALQGKRAALDAAVETLDKYRETMAIDAVRESSARPLADSGALSREDYLKVKEQLVQDRDDLAAQVNTAEEAKDAVGEAEHAVEQVRQDRAAEIFSDLDQRVAQEPALKGDLDKSRELYALKWLRAPVDGVVQEVDVTTVGQVVTPAQSLVTIVPDGTPLIVEATVTNEDIGYVRVGQPVQVKVDTFPFQKYGTLPGTLTWISPDAEDKNAASKNVDARSGVPQRDPRTSPENPNAGYVYKVHIRTDQPRFRVQGALRPVQAGMTVQADITTDRRRVIAFFLSPVVKYLDEGLKVR